MPCIDFKMATGNNTEMAFWDHLEALRGVLFKAGGVIIVAAVALLFSCARSWMPLFLLHAMPISLFTDYCLSWGDREIPSGFLPLVARVFMLI